MSNELAVFEEQNLSKLQDACDKLAKSKMIPFHLQGKSDDIFAILVMGAELGIKPMQSLQSINVIQGKPTISPQLMMALIRSKIPGAVIKVESANPNVYCTTARSKEDFDAGLFFKSEWNMNKATKLGLASKDNYTKQAETMLRWRAIAESCRVTFPDILMGLYAPEEFQNFDGKVINSEVVTKQDSKEMLEADFPIPEEEKTVGDLYRVQNGKFRGKQLKDLSLDEIAEYREELINRKTKKEWETDLISVFSQYLNSMEDSPIGSF